MENKITAVLIDDEPAAVESTQYLLAEYCPTVQVVGTANSVQAGIEAIDRNNPDVIFLDVQMPHGGGFALLEHYEKPTFQVIFATAYDSYAIRAFEYSAVDYLLKPYRSSDLVKAIEKAQGNKDMELRIQQLELLRKNMEKPAQMIIPVSGGTEIIALSDLVYLEADNNYTTLYLRGEKKILVSKTLKFFVDQLPDEQFYRVHHSYLVQRGFIEKIASDGKTLDTSDFKATIPISTRRKPAFMKWLKTQP